MKSLVPVLACLFAIACMPVNAGDVAGGQKLRQYEIPANSQDGGFVAYEAFGAEPFAAGEVSRFMFEGWSGPAIPVWVFVPKNIDAKQAPILFMMHGAKRNPARYLLEWVPHAQQYGFIVIAPEFSKNDFKGSRGYNRGNIWKKSGEENVKVDEHLWSFSAIEPLFDHAKKQLGNTQSGYSLYGHSAGSQFVHRFLFHKPDARVKRYLAANAGWYTMPDMAIEYPYGLARSGVSKQARNAALAKSVVVLLGDQDIDTKSSSLRKSPPAMRQGQHRYERGKRFFAVAQAEAEKHNIPLGWQIQIVEGVGHSNGGMAKAAAPFVQ